MVHCGCCRCIDTIMILVTIQMNVSFVWSFFIGYHWRWLHRSSKIERSESKREREKNECMVCSVWIIFTFYSDLITYLVFICFTLNCLLLGSRGHKFINSSKRSICFLKATLVLQWCSLFLFSILFIFHRSRIIY